MQSARTRNGVSWTDVSQGVRRTAPIRKLDARAGGRHAVACAVGTENSPVGQGADAALRSLPDVGLNADSMMYGVQA